MLDKCIMLLRNCKEARYDRLKIKNVGGKVVENLLDLLLPCPDFSFSKLWRRFLNSLELFLLGPTPSLLGGAVVTVALTPVRFGQVPVGGY